jgi:hypothetical protein
VIDKVLFSSSDISTSPAVVSSEPSPVVVVSFEPVVVDDVSLLSDPQAETSDKVRAIVITSAISLLFIFYFPFLILKNLLSSPTSGM